MHTRMRFTFAFRIGQVRNPDITLYRKEASGRDPDEGALRAGRSRGGRRGGAGPGRRGLAGALRRRIRLPRGRRRGHLRPAGALVVRPAAFRRRSPDEAHSMVRRSPVHFYAPKKAGHL